jgi:phosphate transport system substrate-binding protein
MKKVVVLVLALLALTVVPMMGVGAQAGTIVEVAAGNPDFSTLVSLVQAAGLAETLSGEGPFTVFVPTNDAFAALPEAVISYLGANPDVLTAVLTYHVLPAAVPAADAMGMMEATGVATVQGAELMVKGGEGVTVDGVNVIAADVEASNGIIHVIDGVLLPPITLPEIDALAVTGDVIAAGSSTVAPLTQTAIEAFIEAGFAGSITNDSIGTGAGFERFCEAGETDISNASRPIRDSEREACAALATPRTPIEFFVGIDALSVVVSSSNDFATDLTIAELTAIYSGTATTWNAVRPEWPAEAIQVFSPGSDSGTYDYFLEVTLEADAEDGGMGMEAEAAEAAIAAVPGIQFSEDDNVLVQGVGGSPFAIGYFGYAFYIENQDTLNALPINTVAPTAAAVEAGEYPLARPLFIYSDAAIIQAKPQVGAFINFYLTNDAEFVDQVGYFQVSERSARLAKVQLLAAMGGM